MDSRNWIEHCGDMKKTNQINVSTDNRHKIWTGFGNEMNRKCLILEIQPMSIEGRLKMKNRSQGVDCHALYLSGIVKVDLWIVVLYLLF